MSWVNSAILVSGFRFSVFGGAGLRARQEKYLICGGRCPPYNYLYPTMVGIRQKGDEIRFRGLHPHQPAAGDLGPVKTALGKPTDAFLFDFLPDDGGHGYTPFFWLPVAGDYPERRLGYTETKA